MKTPRSRATGTGGYFFSQDGDGYTWHTAQELGNSNYENFCFVGADQQRVLAAPTAGSPQVFMCKPK